MFSVYRFIAIGSLLLSFGASAYGQVDLAGNWAPLYHEDYPERISGPELNDYRSAVQVPWRTCNHACTRTASHHLAG